MRISSASALIIAATTSATLANEPVWDGNTVVLESQKLADGVFAVVPTGAAEMAANGYPIATTGGFVIGDNAVLVVESMLNQRLNGQLFELIAAETDKPVRYLVNTSFHGDHSYGNHYVPEEVDIIQHADTAAYIHSHFEADTAFMIQNFGQGRGIEEVEPADADILVSDGGQISINLGGVTVDIRDFGYAQTGGDLFVSVPEADVLWTGNAVVAQAPALPWLLDGHLIETRDTLQAVFNSFDSDTRVVPGHGPVTDMGAIKWNIDYLNAVETEVKAAISDGLSLEETVGRVKLEEFAGYALFGWVHPGMNVPAAYADLN
ncbi:MBL fold metallo-hydrolase [Alisedimentitalea sp. MJ-SS2]|uniref:MBL fold metallo-hydrolase n=1 Tax=Aliisedimentitalea sp. MJ-SS2 TaxID=3049795 RepID=UPI00290E3440|nr:MBL fold metallo-hydrolase [Alisedimentitalea sp. MJ-SS2]MDU8929639.1 MBL fold metallo-hydrolase [Alisedimentitalea sp. MJ-SS2]